MKYEVRVKSNVVKKIETLPKTYIPIIFEKIFSLRNDPRPSGCKKLRGYQNLWRIRVGVYRIIYSIEDQIKVVEVRKVLHRKDSY